MALAVGQTLDTKYRIVRIIGVGGMGTVYEGENTLIRRRVAIKVLADDSSRTPDSVRRFEREAQAAGQIGSDHILEVLDLGTTEDGHRYMVMEYLEGETLEARLARMRRMSPAQIAVVARQVLAGLAAAHEAGIIHRDLKPGNVFILREKAGLPDFVKIIDFGISKFEQPGVPSRLTQSGAVLGTPYYMSPEQARGKTVDARSDLHAVGVILFEAVTGRMPYEGANFNELMFAIGSGQRPRASDVVPGLDPGFEAIIERALMLQPDERYQTAHDFAKELEAWMRANSISTKTGEIVLADVAAALLAPLPEFDRSAPTLEMSADAQDHRRRTVTNASVDTLSTAAVRGRRWWRWGALGAGIVLSAGAAGLVMRRAPTSVAPSAQPVASPGTVPGASQFAASAAAPVASASASFQPAASPASSAAEPRRKTRPPKGVARPIPGGKPVDFGY